MKVFEGAVGVWEGLERGGSGGVTRGAVVFRGVDREAPGAVCGPGEPKWINLTLKIKTKRKNTSRIAKNEERSAKVQSPDTNAAATLTAAASEARSSCAAVGCTYSSAPLLKSKRTFQAFKINLISRINP